MRPVSKPELAPSPGVCLAFWWEVRRVWSGSPWARLIMKVIIVLESTILLLFLQELLEFSSSVIALATSGCFPIVNPSQRTGILLSIRIIYWKCFIEVWRYQSHLTKDVQLVRRWLAPSSISYPPNKARNDLGYHQRTRSNRWGLTCTTSGNLSHYRKEVYRRVV